MVNYVRSFILSGPKSYGSMLDKKLQRSLKRPGRQWPPSYLELQVFGEYIWHFDSELLIATKKLIEKIK